MKYYNALINYWIGENISGLIEDCFKKFYADSEINELQSRTLDYNKEIVTETCIA